MYLVRFFFIGSIELEFIYVAFFFNQNNVSTLQKVYWSHLCYIYYRFKNSAVHGSIVYCIFCSLLKFYFFYFRRQKFLI